MRTPPGWGGAAEGEGLDEAAWLGSSIDTLLRRRPQAPPRQPRRPEAAQARLHTQTERLAWRAYLRAVRLQEDEPGPVTLIIRNATFKVWERIFLADEAAPWAASSTSSMSCWSRWGAA